MKQTRPHNILGRWSAVAWALGVLTFHAAAPAADPLFLQPPFDEIKLDEDNGGVVLRVKSLDLPGRKLPPEAERVMDLEIELLERPGEKFALPWMNIASVKFFEQLVLAEADQVMKEGRFDDAQPYYVFLEGKYPQTPGLKDSVELFLWQQILAAFRAGKHDETLALLVELHGRNPQRTGLANAYQRVTVELVKRNLAAENYRAARGLLRNLGTRFPEFKETTLVPYEGQLTQQAQTLLNQAQAANAAGNLRAAHEAVTRALDIWPAVAGGRELALAVHEKYPVVGVAVSSPGDGRLPQRIDDWAAARAARLVGRPLAERSAPGAEGGPYQSPLGELTRGAEPGRLMLRIKPDLKWSVPARGLTAHDVARSLLAQADASNAAYDPVWASQLSSAVAGSRSEIELTLARPQPLPEASLRLPLMQSANLPLGPYKLESHTPAIARFVREPGYFATGAKQPGEIIERVYPDAAAALRGLRRGEVSMIDRVNPWDIATFAATGGVTVKPYALPTVHVLVPNPARPLMNQRAMRRAILYGIDRPTILQRGLLGGGNVPGCEVVSGPFPKGATTDDFADAYNDKVEVRPYEPGTALVLARLARDEVSAESPTSESAAPLVLLHPPSPVARVACQSLARQLAAIGLAIGLREETAGQPPAPWDLRYAELSIREPAADAWRLLGPQGATGACSPAMLAALRALDAAPTKADAASKLQAIHRLAAAELPVIPLWQIAEHCACHSSLEGVGDRPESLYQNVEQWTLEPRIPTE
jgi:ABC-type transport system substrate-binding protein